MGLYIFHSSLDGFRRGLCHRAQSRPLLRNTAATQWLTVGVHTMKAQVYSKCGDSVFFEPQSKLFYFWYLPLGVTGQNITWLIASPLSDQQAELDLFIYFFHLFLSYWSNTSKLPLAWSDGKRMHGVFFCLTFLGGLLGAVNVSSSSRFQVGAEDRRRHWMFQ